jgi:hypothetical protein
MSSVGISISNALRALDAFKQRYSSPSKLRRKLKLTTSKKPKRKFFRKRAFGTHGDPIPMNIITENTSKDIYLGATDLTDMLTSQMLYKRILQNLECGHDSFGIYVSMNNWRDYINLLNLRRVQVSMTRGFLFDDVNLSYLEYSIHPTHVHIELVGDLKFIDSFKEKLTSEYEVVINHIEWLYSSDGHSIEIPIRHDRKPIEEMYPFLNGKSLEEYYDDFMESSASILLLIGPPGTGKTTFIRGLLQHCNISAMVSYDSGLLEKDYAFANFIESDKSVLVLEDADMFLKSRQEGNTMMHKFLNVGDGLVTTRNKKLVFSTNLPSIRDIDSALVRPGRCYDIITFSELNREQASALAKKVGLELKGNKEKWTISDIFFEQNVNTTKPVNRKVGFI